jgi:hypothetical protein
MRSARLAAASAVSARLPAAALAVSARLPAAAITMLAGAVLARLPQPPAVALLTEAAHDRSAQ